jgi:hypothetical protein
MQTRQAAGGAAGMSMVVLYLTSILMVSIHFVEAFY